jgi:hypothetical protein
MRIFVIVLAVALLVFSLFHSGRDGRIFGGNGRAGCRVGRSSLHHRHHRRCWRHDNISTSFAFSVIMIAVATICTNPVIVTATIFI